MSAAAETLPAADARIHTPVAPLAPPVPPPPRPPPRSVPAKHTVHWFRKGLRLHDNPALREGLIGATTFRCVFIIDPWFASSSNVGINKWRFLLECLKDLDSSLRKLNSRLFVVRGQPADVLPKLFREWGTTSLTFEEDPEPYGRVRDHNIISKCRECDVTVTSKVSHTLFKLDKIIERNGGKAPLTYHQFQALIASMPPPQPAEPAVMPQMLNGAKTPVNDDHDDRFGVPTLEELGFDTENLKPAVWIGGETEALARLEKHLERKAWVASFGRPKMSPESLRASQTGLSPYLRFGCLSTRLFYYQLTELYKRVKGERPPLSLHGQILWREFFYCAATRNPNFDRMEGNPICVQIPWEKNSEALAKWANGTTGFPWIDAIMIQLREEGWIHHLARHAVACFLTRGDLWISWEEGMKVFDELLLDADWSVNAGMWMWLSCSSFFQQFFHCYCPVRFGRKTDPNGDFIRQYIPALKNMPTRFIHEPWEAPETVQTAARCILGRDYPLPMVDHGKASQLNLERIKQVYAHLAKFKPQVALNPQTVQRPSVTQSSPSPTSIISNINQSNFLCSQTPNSQSTPQIIPYKDSEVFQQPDSEVLQRPESELFQRPDSEVLQRSESELFQRPDSEVLQRSESELFQRPDSEVLQRSESELFQRPDSEVLQRSESELFQRPDSEVFQRLNKYKFKPPPPLKEIVITQQQQNSNITIGNISNLHQRKVYVSHDTLESTYKSVITNLLPPLTQGNINFKNLAIHNYVAYSNTQEFQTTHASNKFHQQVLNKNSYCFEKPKFYLPTYGSNTAMAPTSQTPREPPEPDMNPALNCNSEPKMEESHEKDDEFLNLLSINADESYIKEDDDNESNQCE